MFIAAFKAVTMGHQTSPSEAAPAYDRIFTHPTNTHPHPSGSTSGYTTIPQNEPDIELAQDRSTPVDSSKPHQHCETCDALTTAREVRANERFCCRASDRERGGDAAGHSRFGGRVQATEWLGIDVLLHYSDCVWGNCAGLEQEVDSRFCDPSR